MKPFRSFSALAFFPLALLLGVTVAQAQTIIDDFNTGSDSAWTRVDPLGNATYSFPAGNTYRIQAPISPSPGTVGAARAGAIREDATFGDFDITVDLVGWDNSSSTHQSIGIVARVGDVGAGTTDGYFFHYDPFGSNGHPGLWIETITDEAPSSINFQQIAALDPALGYRLEFSGTGDNLTGRVYALSDLSTVLYEIDAIDSTYTSGYAGLLVADQGRLQTGNQSADATFDNFSVTAVPEPSASVLIGGVAAGVSALYFRRRRTPKAIECA